MTALCGFCFLLSVLGASSGSNQNLDIQHGRAAVGGHFAVVDAATVLPPGLWAAQLQTTYLYEPLLLFNAQGKVLATVVGQQLALIPGGAYGVLPGLEISGTWLVAPYERLGAVYTADGFLRQASQTAGVGDVWLQGKYAMLQQGDAPVDLAVSLGLHVPSMMGAYLSDGSVAGVPRVLFGWHWRDASLVANAGAVLRRPQVVAGLTLAQQALWQVGVAYQLTALQLPAWQVSAEAWGLVDISHVGSGQNPSEVLAAVRYDLGNIWLSAGGGRGISGGYGAPTARAHLMVTWAPKAAAPAPVAAPADVPVAPPSPPDSDHDGVDDPNDSCPDAAEDHALPAPADGCPAVTDRDHDGVADANDRCPDQAADPNQPRPDGCPVVDSDGDGIVDDQDKCPQEAEDKPGADADGCPHTDSDHDGIPDDQDKCPDQAEVINGVDDADGCPDEGQQQLVHMNRDTIEMEGRVFFGVGSEVLLPRAFRVLDQLAALLTNHKNVRIRVEGHTDEVGSKRVNMRLSKRRAMAVRRYLINKGIDAERIEAEGVGERDPNAPNDDPRGRALNRRVTIMVIKPAAP